MSMAINRISASGVAAMLSPVTKPQPVAKVDSGNRASVAAATSIRAVQGVSGSQSDSSSPEQAHTAFQYALTALSSVATTNAPAQSSPEVQSSDGQQAGVAYAQVEQQDAGQVLDLTA